jgi:hypothetical protein
MPPAMAEQDGNAATPSALALFASRLSYRRYYAAAARLPQPTCRTQPRDFYSATFLLTFQPPSRRPAPDWVRLRCRFGDEDLRVLEAALSAGADVPALLATRSAARSLLQASAAEAFASTATGDGGRSLAVADFFARAFALVGDVEVSTAPNEISAWRIQCAELQIMHCYC